MAESTVLISFVAAQRLAELIWAERNTRRLVAAGGRELGRGHYPAIVALHAAWFVGLCVLGWDHAVDRIMLGLFVVLQAARIWVLASLGSRWTTRIIVTPGRAAVSHGPYRFLRHPNYLIVALEIAVVPLALGLPAFAVVFSLLNAAILAIRIRAENAALAWATSGARALSLTPAQADPALANGGRKL
jgi:methyltransferase